jgi:2-dehydro-3-deoxyphosphogluconate aldolase/(4S)-4-hydroxy-2-oxoglutarate aldolase
MTGQPDAMDIITADRALTVVRAPAIPDAVALAKALSDGGIRAVELTFTTPDVLTHVAGAAQAGYLVGVGTVLTGDQAKQAIDAGARFLVTPGVRPDVAAVASEFEIPVLIGALTPTEVQAAVDLGAAAVKIFPAKAFGPGYLKDLHGPYPQVPLIPSGGVNAGNAAAFLQAGALAVTAGTDVVPPALVAAGSFDDIRARAAAFVAACNAPPAA